MAPTVSAGPRSPAGAVTFLFTDIEGSTALWERSPDAMQIALARHDAILREGIGRHGGIVFRTAGDAFYATFAQARDALAAASWLQEALRDEPWPAATPIRVRMALHTGDAQQRAGDWFGPPLNVVARLLSAGRGGQALVSAAANAAAGGQLPAGTRIERHGHYRLKGVESPVEVYELGVPGRDALAPPMDTDHVYRVVPDGELWYPIRAIRHNLPAERDAFVGRSAELRAIAQRLDAGDRLLTVLGPAGMGKTRFACRYGRTWLGDWPGGVYFCDLSEARSQDGIHFAMASALDVALGSADGGVQLGHAIASRGRCLVIMDNFEQVVNQAAATLGRWLERAADASFVVTSRERLHVAGEQVFPIEPLALGQDALDLFAVRARAQQPDFALTDANRPAVAEVVRLLDGLPLAIELAAARVRVFAPAQLVERMRNRFALLAGARGTTARQATLKAAIDWSWDLLAPWEQAALGQCSVFEGGFTIESAEAVLDLSRWPDAPPTMDAVQALVDKSLLRVWHPVLSARYDLDEPYFGMYLSIHEYAMAKLEASRADATRDAHVRHGDCFARLGTEDAVDSLYRHHGVKRRHALAVELDNLVTACQRALARGDATTGLCCLRAAWEVIEQRGPFAVGMMLGAQLLALPVLTPELRAAALRAQGRILWKCGRMGDAGVVLAESLALCRQTCDRRGEGLVLHMLGVVASDQGRTEEAQARFEAALAVHRSVGNRRAEGTVLSNLSARSTEQGRLDEALALAEQALAIHRELGNRLHEAMVIANIGLILLERGLFTVARRHFESAIAIQRETGSRASEGNTLGNLANLYVNLDLLDEAQASQEASLAIAREMGDRRREGVSLGNLANVYASRGQFSQARAGYDAALAIHREVGNRRFEGIVLTNLAELLLRQGLAEEADAAIAEGQLVLREVGDDLSLCSLVCVRGRAEAARGRLDQARVTLAAAEALIATIGAGPDSEVGKAIDRLREATAARNH